MDVRLVIFDLDGTLLGDQLEFQELRRKLIEELRIRELSFRNEGLNLMYESLWQLSKKSGVPFDELYSIIIELETKRMEEAYSFRGSKEVLEFLRNRGLKLALITRSSRRATEKALEKTGLGRYFELIVTRDDVPLDDLKPNPSQLRRILKELDVPPEKTVVIGDHEYDIVQAKKLGCLSVLVTSNGSGQMSFEVEVEPDFQVQKTSLLQFFSMLLSSYVVVPAYNEEATIGAVLSDLLKYFKRSEIVVVNDGSSDRTEEIARSYGVRVLDHLINRGLGGALGTGIAYSLRKGAEVILTFDADGQHRVNDALRVMKPVVEGSVDFAVGSRLKGDVREMPLIKRFGNFVLDFITALFARKYVSDSQSGLRCISRECASRIRITCDRYAVSSELIIEASKAGCKIVEVPIRAVYTEYSMKKGTNVLEGIKIALNLMFDKLR